MTLQLFELEPEALFAQLSLSFQERPIQTFFLPGFKACCTYLKTGVKTSMTLHLTISPVNSIFALFETMLLDTYYILKLLYLYNNLYP